MGLERWISNDLISDVLIKGEMSKPNEYPNKVGMVLTYEVNIELVVSDYKIDH